MAPKLVVMVEMGALLVYATGLIVGVPVVAAIGGCICGGMGLINLFHYIYHYFTRAPSNPIPPSPYEHGILLAIGITIISMLASLSIYRTVILVALSVFIICSVLSYQGPAEDLIMNARICIRALCEINMVLFITMMLIPMTIGVISTVMTGILVGILTLIPTIMTLNWVSDRRITQDVECC